MRMARNLIASIVVAGSLVGASAFAQQAGAPETVTFLTSEAAGEMSQTALVGLKVKNLAGEVIGDINYLVIDGKGQVTTVVLGVGGMLGVGEKNVGVPFSAVRFTIDGSKNINVTVNTSKDALQKAPAYQWTEKTVMQKVQEKAKDLTDKAKETAKDLTEKAKEKAHEMREKMSTEKPAPAPANSGTAAPAPTAPAAPAQAK